MEESTEKYTVYNGRIVTPETIKQLKNHAIVHVVDRLLGGGKKKGQKKQDKGETSPSESDAFADMFLELIWKDSRQGNSFFQTLMQLDEGVAQETIDVMKQAIAAEAESFGIRDLPFEAVERWIQENRQATKHAAKAQQDRESQEQERTIQEAKRREHDVEKFKEEQRQIMMEKERQARQKREHHKKEAEKQQEMNMKEMKIRFGRYHGRAFESIYQEDRNYCRWVQDVETGNSAVIEFKNFIKARDEQWEEECRERKRIELEREMRIEENRRAAETEAKEKERIMKQIRRAEMENGKMEDNHNTDDNAKNFTTEAQGSKARADDLTTEAKGSKAKADNFTTEAKGSKAKADDLTREEKNDNARADDLATEAEDKKARTEESRGKSEAATREDTIEITTKTTTKVNEQGGEFPFTLGREIPRNEVKVIVSQRTETGIQTSVTGHEMGEQWENYWRNDNWGKRF